MTAITVKAIKTSQEIDHLYELIKIIWPEVFTTLLGEAHVAYMLDNYQSPEKIKSEIDAGVVYYFVEAEEEIVGYLAYDLKADHMYISKLYLLNSVRGKGLSRSMLGWLEHTALDNHKDKLMLNVNRFNARAISVYKHMGFESIAEIDTPFGDFMLTDYRMEKQLSSKF